MGSTEPTPEQVEKRRANWRAYYYRTRDVRLVAAREYRTNLTGERLDRYKAQARAYQKEYRKANPSRYDSEKYKARRRAWQKANPEKIAAQDRRNNLRRYGLTPETYDAMLEAQGGVCAICHLPETKVIKGRVVRLSVDHSPIDRRVRGLLCFRCNALLAGMGDDPTVLRRAAGYLEGVLS